MSPDVAMRTTALACFLLSSILLWGLVRHVGGRAAALAALAVYLFSPFSLLWSRASLIEYLAGAGADAVSQWRFQPRPGIAPEPTYTVATLGFEGGREPGGAVVNAHCRISDLAARLGETSGRRLLNDPLRQDLERQRQAQRQAQRQEILRRATRKP